MSCSAVRLQSWAHTRPPSPRAPDHDRTSRGTARITVLVVDDDQRVRRLTARMLRGSGYATLEAGSATEALELLEREPAVRVVVSDIVMPGMHGVELAEQVRALHPHCRVVLVTGYAPDLLNRLGIDRLRHPVVVKPFDAEKLAQQVREVLGGTH